MNLETQFKIINNTDIQRYLRLNSYWYKILNRNPESFDMLIKEIKDKYKLNTKDKIEDFANKLKMVQMFMNVFK